MPKSSTRGQTLKNTMIKKYQDENPGISEMQAYEKWREDMRARASKGGKNSTNGGFASDRELAIRAGRIGGSTPRRRNLEK